MNRDENECKLKNLSVLKMKKLFDRSWIDWVKKNVENKCDMSKLLNILLEEGFDKQLIYTTFQVNYSFSENLLNKAIIMKNAKRFPSKIVELYTIPNFLNPEQCKQLINISKKYFTPSTLSNKATIDRSIRSGQTAHVGNLVEKEYVRFLQDINAKICQVLHIPDGYSESYQVHNYQVGDEFKEHTDYFDPNTDEYRASIPIQGQRTWTFMIYLNKVQKGGATYFPILKKKFIPQTGMALLWNNMTQDGVENPNTRHAGQKVIHGEKYILTKWFREKTR